MTGFFSFERQKSTALSPFKQLQKNGTEGLTSQNYIFTENNSENLNF